MHDQGKPGLLVFFFFVNVCLTLDKARVSEVSDFGLRLGIGGFFFEEECDATLLTVHDHASKSGTEKALLWRKGTPRRV